MITYSDYEKTVFDWLMAKHEIDEKFTFSLRKKFGKGMENDIFIGTNKSNYFATTFWALRNDYPGSSGEAVGLVFKLSKEGYSYFIELNQTNKPHNEQNKSVLQAVKEIYSQLPKFWKSKGTIEDTFAMFNIKIEPREAKYHNLDLMLIDIDAQLEVFIPIVDKVLQVQKENNPTFIGQRISIEDFNLSIQKKQARDLKGSGLDDLILQIGKEVVDVYLNTLKRLIIDLELTVDSKKIYFNYDQNSLIFGIGQRYVLNVKKDDFFRLISKNKSSNKAEEFTSEPKAFLNIYPLNHNIDENYSDLLIAAKDVLAITEKTGYYKYDKKDFRNLVFGINNIDSNLPRINPEITLPKNQIFYGPPGTGKTYNTINKALEIIGIDINGLERAEIKKAYDRKVVEGQIVFTTFHQSLAYEDFIEGIKPEIEEDKDGIRSVVYQTQDGIFKRLCTKASTIDLEKIDERVFNFDDGWNELVAQIQNHLENENDFVLDILTPKKGLKATEITNNGNLRFTPMNTPGLETTVSYSRAKELQKVITDLSLVKNIDKEFRAIIGGMNSTAYWAVLNFINKWLKKENQHHQATPKIKKELPHVLIIDEINRGNVSSIFGELITCIEDSKRLGNVEELTVTLPYSKTSFGVPNNVYIIGTMNTADRSVEALDTALRRRFSFVEMLPDTNHPMINDIDGIDLKELLFKINQRLEKLVSKDHTIGHSFFISLDTVKDLHHAFYNKIIPLLQEYFFGDYGKIGLVLGAKFVEETKGSYHHLFADFDYEDRDLLMEKKIYRINDFRDDLSSFIDAVKSI